MYSYSIRTWLVWLTVSVTLQYSLSLHQRSSIKIKVVYVNVNVCIADTCTCKYCRHMKYKGYKSDFTQQALTSYRWLR